MLAQNLTHTVVGGRVTPNKEPDMLSIPNAGHGFGAASNDAMVPRWNDFMNHLLDAEPPRNDVSPATPAAGGGRESSR